MLEDDIVLRFRVLTNTCEITIKTTIVTVTHQQQKLSLRRLLLIRMLYRSLVNRYMTMGSLATHHNKHRKQD